MSKPIKTPKELHLWAGVVHARGQGGTAKPVVITAFASDRDAVVAILKDVTFGVTIDKAKFQQVTVTAGWGGATRATVLQTKENRP